MGELRQVTTAIFGHWIRAPGISGGPSQFCLGEYKPRGHSSNIVYSRHQEIFKFWRGGLQGDIFLMLAICLILISSLNRLYYFLNDFAFDYSTGNDSISSSEQHSPCKRPIPRLPQTSGFSRTQSGVGSQESPKYSSQHQSERLSKCLQVHLLFLCFVLNKFTSELIYYIIRILTYKH